MIYLDNAATTKPHPAVLDEVCRMMAETWANPSSQHELGASAAARIDRARVDIANCIGALPDEVMFTSGGTEADNLAIIGAVRARKRARRILVSSVEHQAVLRAAGVLAAEGIEVEELPVDSNCVVKADTLAAALKKPADLVSVMWVNNEVGSIQPVADLARISREAGALFHCDAVQAFGKVELDVQASGVDLLTLSAHKIHGPKGVGLLYVRKGLAIRPILVGGGQEGGLRSGTENVPGIAGFAVAARLADPSESSRITALRDELESLILAGCPDTSVNAAGTPRVCHISNISFPMLPNNYLLNRLAQEGVCATSGSACHSHTLEPSHVLQAMRRSHHDAQSAVRFSLSANTTREEILKAAAIVTSIAKELALPV